MTATRHTQLTPEERQRKLGRVYWFLLSLDPKNSADGGKVDSPNPSAEHATTTDNESRHRSKREESIT